MPPYTNSDCYRYWPYLSFSTSMSDSANGHRKSSENVRHTNSSASTRASGGSKENFQRLVVQVDVENDGQRLDDGELQPENLDTETDTENHQNGVRNGEILAKTEVEEVEEDEHSVNGVSESNESTKSASSPNLSSSEADARSVACSSDFNSSVTTIYGSCKSSFSTSTGTFYSAETLNDMNFSSSSTIDALDDEEEEVGRLTPDESTNETRESEPEAQRLYHERSISAQDDSFLSPATIAPALSTLSLPALTNSQRRPSFRLRIGPSSSFASLKRRRCGSENEKPEGEKEDQEMDSSRIWLYKAKTPDAMFPDIVLHLEDEDDNYKDMSDKDEDALSPVLTPEDLFKMAEQDDFPRDVEVYVEYDDPNTRRGTRYFSFQADPAFSSRRRVRDSARRSTAATDDEEVRRESTRKMSNISRVLIVDDDNQFEDLMQIQVHALERRLSRDNLKAINILSFLGDELSIDSGERTPVGFEYSDNVLKIRFLISWKAAEVEVKHKKTHRDTEIPLGATKIYTRPISKWARFIRTIKVKCTGCFFFIFRFRCGGCRDYSDDYATGLVETASIEAFQQELFVMEHAEQHQRHSTVHEPLTGETDSIRKLQEKLEKGKHRQKKRKYRNELKFH